MDYLRFEDYKKNNDSGNRKLNKKKTIIVLIIVLLIITAIILGALYVSNREFRYGFDKYILHKEISQENVNYIALNIDDTSRIFAYDKYIVTLNKNILTSYSSSGKPEFTNEITISNPVFSASGSYLAIGEKGGQKIYLVSGANSLWQKDIEGSISKVSVNKNGYMAVIVTDTSYKTVIILLSPDGKELFKTYLSSTVISNISISNNNKYVALGEIDTSGAIIKTNVKIISIDKGQNDPSNSIVYTHSMNSDNLITNIKFQDKDVLVCLYNDSIKLLLDNNIEDLKDISDSKITYTDISLNNSVLTVEEKSTNPFSAESEVKIVNVQTKKESSYILDSIVKNLYTNNNIIALNVGAEVHFINTSGWLVKRYISSQEIRKIVLGDTIAGIIYTDKIEIINI